MSTLLTSKPAVGLPLKYISHDLSCCDLDDEDLDRFDNGGSHDQHSHHVPKLVLPRPEASPSSTFVPWNFENDFGDSPRDLLFDKLDGSPVDFDFLSDPHASTVQGQKIHFEDKASTVQVGADVSSETRGESKNQNRKRRRRRAAALAAAAASADPPEAMPQRGDGNGTRPDLTSAQDTPTSATTEGEQSVEWPADATTVMLRNIPNRYIAEELLAEIMEEGFEGQLDFFYLPIDFSTKRNRGYAFINFHTTAIMFKFVTLFDDRRLTRYATKKVLRVTPATTQGLEANVKAFVRKDAQRIVNPWFRPLIFGRSSDVGEIASSNGDCSR
eukprot:TRINITY_DN4772_c1_g1_i1.p1 TRINITY_DN4772_c1_g1~~TRINITY_DN4772_c1_g1_i1.p1  ORF type:complete len:349 (-),score=56.69 TRINITY_DN4772_c1_g1_i1:340-1326(-)